MSVALDVTSAVYCPVVPSDWIAVATSPLDAFGGPAVPVKTNTFAGAASASAAPTMKNVATNASAFHAARQIGGDAALRFSLRSLRQSLRCIYTGFATLARVRRLRQLIRPNEWFSDWPSHSS